MGRAQSVVQVRRLTMVVVMVSVVVIPAMGEIARMGVRMAVHRSIRMSMLKTVLMVMVVGMLMVVGVVVVLDPGLTLTATADCAHGRLSEKNGSQIRK